MNLLTAVGTYRENDDTNNRPIIFVAHSLGGLVCQDVSYCTFLRHVHACKCFAKILVHTLVRERSKGMGRLSGHHRKRPAE